MTLVRNALTWNDKTIGGADADVHLDEGIEGLGLVPVDSASTPRAMGGEFGGVDRPQARTITARAWVNCEPGDDPAEIDFAPLWEIRSAMGHRVQPDDELPLAWAGLMWPGEHCVFARPRRCEFITDEEGSHEGAPGVELQWYGADPTGYSYAAAQRLWETDDPVTGDSFEVANDGDLVPWARRAFDLRLTAHGSVVNARVRVDHDDGTFEQITFETTMTGGQVLTVGADLLPRIGSRIISGVVRSLTEAGVPSRAPRWWLSHPSTGSDGVNEVTLSRASGGSLSGYLRTRGTRF